MADSKLIDLTATASVASTDLFYTVVDPAGTPLDRKITVANTKTSLGLTGTNSGDQNVFSTIAVSGQSDVVADSTTDTLTLAAGSNVTITTNATTDTITISASGTGGGVADPGANGVMVRTALDTSTARTITGTANEVTVTNGDGVSGNPTLSLPATIDLGGKTSLEIPNGAAPTVDADGEIAVDTTVTDFSHGIVKYFSGEELGVVAMPIAQFTTPGDGEVIAYNATNDEFELVAASGGTTMLMGYKTADQTTTSATGVDITSMVFAIGASEVWCAEFHMGLTVSAAAGVKFAVTVPSGATMGGYVRGTQAAPAVITVSGTLTANAFATSPSGCSIYVLVQNSTNAGNVQVQFASADGIVSAVAKGNQCYYVARKIS